eukprot:CAMPEP_0195283552 /NCGR_PEP_ID=MMETSP0707-20130614/2055_1 /TAXON_ID=33640 /ORGANISM="Asterionellopsis glacialis, Strain CCMP134" /LENGTH=799 /DNA_ID=CAMNT_0040342737 /DNA_START=157 /DNA_END=2556 /DNA_ORIENTATION=-
MLRTGSRQTLSSYNNGRVKSLSVRSLSLAKKSSKRVLASLQQDYEGSVSSKFFSSLSSSSSSSSPERDPGLALSSIPTYPKEVQGPAGLPSRAEQLRRLKEASSSTTLTEQPYYDVLIVGGGATGAGAALDAATRGLKVACVERGDFASETSSRSTKLIWAGIRYMATASVSLLSPKLFTNPLDTLRDFYGEMKMVYNCHRERRYMTSKQRHLCNWVPIAIPFTSWHVSPPPFGHWLFGFFPVLAPFVLKLYDGLSAFTCPPSYTMGKKKAKLAFPQLSDKDVKYCSVFYEAQHNDSRTNIAIALSAAEHGAHIANYVEVTDLIQHPHTDKVAGVKVVDRQTGDAFEIKASKIVFAGGPFTDMLRQMEHKAKGDSSSDDVTTAATDSMTPAVRGAAGTHLVLPGYYCPNNMGLLDYNTSDGRFLFFLPWEKHTLVGTTDTKSDAKTLPAPPEDEVQWLLNECGKYLSDDLMVRRSDVLSAWVGWRPLAVDPHLPPGAPVSRDHVISENPKSGVIFIAGGKWTTWREMAEEVVDRVVGPNGPKSKTLDLTLFGGEGYSRSLDIQLIQKHGMTQDTAEHLAKTYGGNAWEVCELSQPTKMAWPRFGIPLARGYPYIDAEVVYACREYACTIEDVLSRRTRLAFLNKEAALSAVERVANIMAVELGWSEDVKAEQIIVARKYVESYAGRIPKKVGASLREATYEDLKDIFEAIDRDCNGFLDRTELGELAEALGFPLSVEELDEAFAEMDTNMNGRVSLQSFEAWWNRAGDSAFHRRLSSELSLGGTNAEDIRTMGGGVFLG